MSDVVTVHVSAEGQRRCRCGRCYDALGEDVSVSAGELARLQADPLLLVTDVPAAADAAAAAAPATETTKPAATADKKAG